METKYLSADLADVMRFWIEHYQLPENTYIWDYEWFWNPEKGRVMFKVSISEGTDPRK